MKEVNTRSAFLQQLVKCLPPNPICVEVGVHQGTFSEMMIQELNPGKLFLVDPWEIGDDLNANGQTYDETLGLLKTAYSTDSDLATVQERFSSQIQENRVEILKDYSYNAVDNFKDLSLDLVYIDACHLYESVKADLAAYLPKLKLTGVMSGHDYFEYSNFGVIQAVDEFLESNPGFEFSIFNNSDGGYDWALTRKS